MTQRLIEPTTVQAGPGPSVRRLVARHPVAAFLGICYAVTWATAVPWFRARTDVLPFDLPMWGSLGTIFGVALAAVLVVAASDGRAGVRDLARRSLRWRVGVRWYLLAVLGLPVVVLAGTLALFGTAAACGAGRRLAACCSPGSCRSCCSSWPCSNWPRRSAGWGFCRPGCRTATAP